MALWVATNVPRLRSREAALSVKAANACLPMRTAAFVLSLLTLAAVQAEVADWKSAEKRAVVPDAQRHSIHAYFNTCPESPDGRLLPDAQCYHPGMPDTTSA